MEELISGLYREYGKYVNSSRAFPLDLDGLKPVERKILLSAYNIAREKFVKSARVAGDVMGHYHPHADCYPTIVQLVNQGFLEGQGNFGTDVGVEEVGAAASRYTETRLAKSTKELAFKLIDHVTWEVNELDQKEPIFLPTMFPMCLIANDYVQGIGFGYRTMIPCYKVEDLHKRLLFLLGKEKEKPIIKPITDCHILSKNDKLEELLTTGKATIEFKGLMKIDNTHSKIIVKSWPNGKKFESILGKLEKELENQDIGFTDLSTTETCIVFEVLKQRNKEEILAKAAKKLEEALCGSVSFEIIVADQDKNVRIASVDELLLNTYNMYKSVNEIMLKSEIKKTETLIRELTNLNKIRPYISKYLKQDLELSESIKKISEDSKVDEITVKELVQKYKISKLLTTNTDISDLQKDVSTLNEMIKKIDKFVLHQYTKIGG